MLIIIISAILIVALALILWFQTPLFKNDSRDSIVTAWKNNGTPVKLTILYPGEATLFPPEITPPTFKWKDENQSTDTWLVAAELEGKVVFTSDSFKQSEWNPGGETWNNLKTLSTGKKIKITVLGYNSAEPGILLSGNSVHISTSTDKVDAPIFYRDVPLPFEYAYKHLESIRWRLGDIASPNPPKVILENLPLCGNCHSFTRDGNTLAMDVDYASDKGAYVISGIEKEIRIKPEEIITWSDYKREDGQMTFGLLSQISPDGRYVLSTVKDRSIFVPVDNLHYSQLFFPIKGIICVYDRQTAKYRSLPGADDPQFVQSNPTWSPDGKSIVFARTTAYHSEAVGNSGKIVLPNSFAKEFIEGKRDFKYDLYRVPFNDGNGGEAEPVPGASGNGMSNYFPRFSPDGKWIVFCQAKNFMLLQKDSTLYILPAEGGTPRKMNCNNSDMNSWHSWSPNGKWLTYASKAFGPYTQLFLTHVDENGMDTPGVLLENFILPERAVNIPEFVNVDIKEWDKIVDNFSDNSHYFVRIAEDKFFSGDYKSAIDMYNKALTEKPNSEDIYIKRADAYAKAGQVDEAFNDYAKAIALNPAIAAAYKNRGDVKLGLKQYSEAIDDFTRALNIKSDFYEAYDKRGLAKFLQQDFEGASQDLNKAIGIKPDDAALYVSRGLIKSNSGDLRGANEDYSIAIQLKADYWSAYLGRAEVRLRLDDLEGAMADYQGVLDKQADSWEAYFGRAELKFRKNDYEGAVADFSEVLRLKPDHHQAYVSRANVKRMNLDLAGALNDMNQAIRFNSMDPVLFSRRGDIKYEMKDLPGALKDYSAANQLKPEEGEFIFKCGMVKILMGLKEDGLNDLRKASSMGHLQSREMLKKYDVL